MHLARTLPTNRPLSSTQKLPFSTPNLSSINHINKKKRLSIPMDQNNHGRQSPLLLTCSQLYYVQHPLKPKKTSQTPIFWHSISNEKRNRVPNAHSRQSLVNKKCT